MDLYNAVALIEAYLRSVFEQGLVQISVAKIDNWLAGRIDLPNSSKPPIEARRFLYAAIRVLVSKNRLVEVDHGANPLMQMRHKYSRGVYDIQGSILEPIEIRPAAAMPEDPWPIMSPKTLRGIFEISHNTLIDRLENQTIPNVKINQRAYRVDPSSLPRHH